MELSFDSKSLRTICESEAEAKSRLGTAVAEVVKHRLADMRAAKSPDDLLAGRPRVLDGKSQNMVLDLCGRYRMIFCANHPNNPMTPNGILDWPKISRVKILWIGCDNDD